MLRSIILENPHWTSDHKSFVYRSKEIQRVMSMDLPAALVIRLPRLAESTFCHLGAFTDILVYFPQSGQAMVFDYTLNDITRKFPGCDIKFYGFFDAFLPESHVAPRAIKVPEYKYAVELSPFLILHSSPCPNKVKAAFIIDCEAVAGVSGIEASVGYDDDHREKESVELRWFHGGNESTLEFKNIGKWIPKRDLNKHILTWESKDGKEHLHTLPHINNYHSKEDD